MALPYRERMERELARLEAARRRLVHPGRRRHDDVRVAIVLGKGQYVAAAELDRYQRLGVELQAVAAKLQAPAAGAELVGDLDPEPADQLVELATTAVSGLRSAGEAPESGDRRRAGAAAAVSAAHSGADAPAGPDDLVLDVAEPVAGAELVTVSPGELVALQARERVERYAAAATAANTVRAYRIDWREWSSWCAEHGYSPLPASPAVIAAYVAELADRPVSVATIERRLAAIGRVHREAEHDPPPTHDLVVKKVVTGIRRTLGVAPRNQRTPLATAELRRLLFSTDPATLAGDRDRALLLVGYYFAGRRSELVALDVEDLVEVAEGLRVRVRRSKTDQEGEGDVKGIPRKADPSVCPVLALQGWLESAGIVEGPIWRRVTRWDTVGPERLTAQSVNLIIKRACRRAGINPERYAGHSLRAGFSTAAGAAQAPERAIMRQTGHRSERMLRKYIRPASVFHENAGAWVNL